MAPPGASRHDIFEFRAQSNTEEDKWRILASWRTHFREKYAVVGKLDHDFTADGVNFAWIDELAMVTCQQIQFQQQSDFAQQFNLFDTN